MVDEDGDEDEDVAIIIERPSAAIHFSARERKRERKAHLIGRPAIPPLRWGWPAAPGEQWAGWVV